MILLHEFKLCRKATEAVRNINQAWGDDTTTNYIAQFWFQRFRSGDESRQDKEGRGRPSSLDDDQLNDLIKLDPRKSTQNLAKELGVNKSTVSRHLEAMGKVKKLDKWVPHELSERQQYKRLEICSSLLLRNQKASILDRIIHYM